MRGWWCLFGVMLALVVALIVQATVGGAASGWAALVLGFGILLAASGIFRPLIERRAMGRLKRLLRPSAPGQPD